MSSCSATTSKLRKMRPSSKNTRILQEFELVTKLLLLAEIVVAPLSRGSLRCRPPHGEHGLEKARQMASGRIKKASCESCFFHQNLLCALSGSGPCATYRPAGPDGLSP